LPHGALVAVWLLGACSNACSPGLLVLLAAPACGCVCTCVDAGLLPPLWLLLKLPPPPPLLRPALGDAAGLWLLLLPSASKRTLRDPLSRTPLPDRAPLGSSTR
jgi:hypothetical protein